MEATPKNTVGISLMASAETEAAIEYVRDTAPDAAISARDCFTKIERRGVLEFDLAAIAERLGRPLDTEMFLVNMSSYYGRIVIEPGWVRIYSEIQPER
jgi:MmoB/DmpM family